MTNMDKFIMVGRAIFADKKKDLKEKDLKEKDFATGCAFILSSIVEKGVEKGVEKLKNLLMFLKDNDADRKHNDFRDYIDDLIYAEYMKSPIKDELDFESFGAGYKTIVMPFISKNDLKAKKTINEFKKIIKE